MRDAMSSSTLYFAVYHTLNIVDRRALKANETTATTNELKSHLLCWNNKKSDVNHLDQIMISSIFYERVFGKLFLKQIIFVFVTFWMKIFKVTGGYRIQIEFGELTCCDEQWNFLKQYLSH